MGQILQNWRVITATLFSMVLVVGVYMFARSVESPLVAQASTESELLQAIATRDSDGDGLSDWEEALYGTDAHITDTFHLSMTDGEAVAKGLVVPKAIANIPGATSSPVSFDADGLPPPPAGGTLTDAFTQSFLALYFSTKQAKGGADLSEADTQNIAEETIKSLSSIVAIAPNYKSAKDLTVSGPGVDALKAFAVNAEAVFLKHSTNVKGSELVYLKDALENNNATVFPYIVALAKSYRDTAVGLAVLPVPKELATDVLVFINALMRKSEIASDLARVNDDPLAAIIALEQYPQVLQSLGTASVHIGEIYQTAHISLPADTPGASFVDLFKYFAARQQAIGKP